jgi:hypothetical protein
VTAAAIDQLAERIAAAVLRKVSDRIEAPQRVAVTVDELAGMLGTKSRSATYRMIAALNLRSVSGKYRVRDVENAVARRTRT